MKMNRTKRAMKKQDIINLLVVTANYYKESRCKDYQKMMSMAIDEATALIRKSYFGSEARHNLESNLQWLIGHSFKNPCPETPKYTLRFALELDTVNVFLNDGVSFDEKNYKEFIHKDILGF